MDNELPGTLEQDTQRRKRPMPAHATKHNVSHTVFTIGHSTRKLEELISVLKGYGIERLIDIRHFPASRHNPQFNKAILEHALPEHGIEYLWLERLGGYREGGYLAYMQTSAFTAGIDTLEKLAGQRRTAYMCAELKWFQCHRRRVSDVLAYRGWTVTHIIDEQRTQAHCLKTNRIKCD
jgi:uncharacterized protein (DUF488 family)